MVTVVDAKKPSTDLEGGSHLANYRRSLELRQVSLDSQAVQPVRFAQPAVDCSAMPAFSPEAESHLNTCISEAFMSAREAWEAEICRLDARLSGQLAQLRVQIASLEAPRAQEPRSAVDLDEGSALRDLLAEHMADHDSQLADLRCRLLQAADAEAAAADRFGCLETEQRNCRSFLTEALAEHMSAQDASVGGDALCERLERKTAQCVEEHRAALIAFASAIETRLLEGIGLAEPLVAEEYEAQAVTAGPAWLSGAPVEALPSDRSAQPPAHWVSSSESWGLPRQAPETSIIFPRYHTPRPSGVS